MTRGNFTSFLLHARTAHFAVIFISFVLILITATNERTQTGAVRSQVKELVTVFGNLGSNALETWAIGRSDPIEIGFVSSTSDALVSFRTSVHGALFVRSGVEGEPFGRELTPGNGGAFCANSEDLELAIAFESRSHTSGGHPIMIDYADDRSYNVRVQFQAPSTVEEAVLLWRHLSSDASILTLEPDRVGYVAEVAKKRSDRDPSIAYQQEPLTVHTVGTSDADRVNDFLDLSSLCLIRVWNYEFRGLSQQIESVSRFRFAYIAIVAMEDEGDRNDNERADEMYDYRYRLFVVPAIERRNDFRDNLLDFLEHACDQSIGTESCQRWKLPFDQAFPELVGMKEIPRTVKFKDVLSVLDIMDRRRTEGEIVLPGASVPIKASARILIMLGIILTQAYLASVAQMALHAASQLNPSSTKNWVPWVALSKEALPTALWFTSLAIPVVSVGFAGFSIASSHLTTVEGKLYNAVILGSLLIFLVSICLSVWTSKVTRGLAIPGLRVGYRLLVVKVLLKVLYCVRRIESYSARRRGSWARDRRVEQIQPARCDGCGSFGTVSMLILLRCVDRGSDGAFVLMLAITRFVA